MYGSVCSLCASVCLTPSCEDMQVRLGLLVTVNCLLVFCVCVCVCVSPVINCCPGSASFPASVGTGSSPLQSLDLWTEGVDRLVSREYYYCQLMF